MNLTDLFDLSLKGRPDFAALEFQGRVHTFGDVEARSNRMAHLLLRRGLHAGDRCAAYLANRVEFIDLYVACIKLGIIFVPVNILYREREISHILGDAEPAAVVSAGEIAGWNVEEIAREAETESSERVQKAALDGDAPAALVYTSGTTGTSKGAILTHNNLASNAVNLLACWQISAADRLLLPLPLFHVHGLGNGLHCWLMSGCRMRLLERFDHRKAADEMLDFRPTLFFGVPTIYVRLLDITPDIARRIGGVMRLFVSGSAPLPAHVHEAFRALFGHTILERYGMTETLMNLSNPYYGERRAGTVGLPLPGVSVRLLNDAGDPVPDGEIGEVHLRGPNVFGGYWRRADATSAAFRDGYFRTGDLALRSPDGYYTLQGRRSDLIISGGFNIYPREIEEFLMEQDEIAEASVVGIADSLRGEIPVAYIVPHANFDPALMEARCKEKLASFKTPRKFVVVEKLPRNALGKVQKHLLQSS